MPNDDAERTTTAPPPAEGLRTPWSTMPTHLRAAVEGWLGSAVVTAVSQPGGFSPGVAARLTTADGRRAFVKAAGPEPNELTPQLHRREARIVDALPPDAPVPRLLWTIDEGEEGWIVLVFEDIEGRQPALPWKADELELVLATLATLSLALTPAPLPPEVSERARDWGILLLGWWNRLSYAPPPELDAWSLRHVSELAELEADAASAADGETLLHLDLRADNLLLTPEGRVLVVDWPHARIGAAWVDVAFLAPSVAMQGGPRPEALLARHPATATADPQAITAVAAAIAGFFTYQALQPAPPGLPTVRAFQAAQGVAAREWLRQRTDWT